MRAFACSHRSPIWQSSARTGYQAVLWDAERRVFWGATESRVDGQAGGW